MKAWTTSAKRRPLLARRDLRRVNRLAVAWLAQVLGGVVLAHPVEQLVEVALGARHAAADHVDVATVGGRELPLGRGVGCGVPPGLALHEPL